MDMATTTYTIHPNRRVFVLAVNPAGTEFFAGWDYKKKNGMKTVPYTKLNKAWQFPTEEDAQDAQADIAEFDGIHLHVRKVRM
jgi:hypothetical protein